MPLLTGGKLNILGSQ